MNQTTSPAIAKHCAATASILRPCRASVDNGDHVVGRRRRVAPARDGVVEVFEVVEVDHDQTE